MSSHREAPAISKDPVADNTDTYAFVSPDDPTTVTIIANYLPLEAPFGGPNFFEFGDDVLYSIHVDNNGDGYADITYEFTFETQVGNPNTFLYNTGTIDSIQSPNWNRKQFYSVTRTTALGGATVLGTGLPCPPCNVGPLSTPDYASLAAEAVNSLPGGRTVFAGQRLEGFYVDLGAIFDLGNLRPFENLHIGALAAAPGVNATNDFSVHSIALKVPKSDLTRFGGTPTNPMDRNAVIGVWATASRRRAVVREASGEVQVGGWVQVSRLGNPLFNEVIVPMGMKDMWNGLPPAQDKQFLANVQSPELASLLPVLYPGVFPTLAGYTAPRADLVAILLTGLPSGIVSGFQNYTGPTFADELRLNIAIPPSSNPNPLGVVGGDLAGFPNGRRVFDDVVSVELRAIAGATIPLVDPSYTPDGAAAVVTDGLTDADTTYLSEFPYLGTPVGGYQTLPLAASS